MHVLTPEERRAKFSNAPKEAGLRSKGAKLLSAEEQERILDDIDNMDASTKLHQLRALREASIASKQSCSKLSSRIFVKSAEVLAETDSRELMPTLERLCTMSDSVLHQRWLALALQSEGHFHRALLLGLNDNDVFKFSRAIVSRDVVLWHSMLAEETNSTTRDIMRRSKHYFEPLIQTLPRAFRQNMTATIENLVACK